MGKEPTGDLLALQAMSVGQRALWFEQQADPAGNAYNVGACLRFPQAIAPAFLDRALRGASRRHPLLRARFDLIGDEACWWAAPEPPACTVLSDAALPWDEAVRRIEQFLLRPYELAHEAPVRFGLQPLEQGCLLAVSCHHIVADLHSLAELVRELDAFASEAAVDGEDDGYARFASEQRQFLHSQAGAEAAAFWRGQLAAVPPVQGLGELESGVPGSPGPAGRIDFTLDDDAGALKDLADKCGTTAFGLLLTTFQVLLAHLAGRDTVVVGAPHSGRRDPRYHRTFGYFVNLLPMAFTIDRAEPFAAALQRNGAVVRQALRQSQLPYPCIAEASPVLASGVMEATLSFQKTVAGLDADLTRTALGLPGGRLALDGQVGELVPVADPRAQLPLGIAIGPVGEGFSGSLQFEPARVAEGSARELLRAWLALVRACCEQPAASVGELLERAAGRRPGGHAGTLLQAVEDALVAHADRPALCDAEASLSYRDLDVRSAAVAAALQARGIGPGDRVAVTGNGSVDTIVDLVGVVRSGAAFVPMDATLPAERLLQLQQAAQVAAVLGPQDPTPRAKAWTRPRVESLAAAWLMFTSGTTGGSKAAVVPQAAALAHARGIAGRFALTADDKVLQFASLSFDEHAEEIFPTLLAGAAIVCSPRVRYEDPERLLEVVREQGVTVLHLPTSYWHLWCDEMARQALPVPPSLRLVNAGGEQASLPRLQQWARQVPAAVRWFNSYGLTEAAVTSLLYELDRERVDALDAVPAGRPLPGTRLRIVGDDGRDVPAGAVGELLLGGAGVGTGYFQSDAAAAARFSTTGGVRWLRTGDLARVVGGQVVIAGRRDRAVKVHGMRLDLSEAEMALGAQPAVQDCALALDPDGDAVHAHVVARPGYALSVGEVQSLLQGLLPGMAIPVRVHFLETMPRTAGRKPDYAALAARAAQPDLPEQAGPATTVEEAVQGIFQRLLQRQPIAPDASFFQLGGHSLLAMRAVAALRRELGVALSVTDFLADPSVQGVSALCRARDAVPARVGTQDVVVAGTYPLSRSQRRLLAMASLAEDADLTVSWLLEIEGAVDPERVSRAWSAVLQAHRLLTARFDDTGNHEDLAGAQLQVPLVALDVPPGATRQQKLAALRSHRGSAVLFKLSDAAHVLAIEASLLAVDGDSVPALLQAFLAAYRGDAAPQKPASYARFVQAEAEWLASPESEAAHAWWSARLQSAPAPTRVGSMRRGAAAVASRRLRCQLSPEVCREVFALASARASSPFAVLLAAFLALLARWSATDDLLIGVPVALRERLGVPETCGPTLNPVPFRAHVSLPGSFAALVAQTQAELAAVLQHAPLPYEDIAASCAALRGEPLPIQFVAQAPPPVESAAGLRITGELQPREGRSPVGLLAGVRIAPGGIGIEFEYRCDMLADAEAAALLRSFRLLVAQLCAQPDRALAAARMLPWSQVRRALAVEAECARSSAPMLLHDGIHAGAMAHPQRVAMRCGPERISYAELDAWTDRHAQRLVQAGVAPGDRVAVVSKNGVDEVLAACAVLKAGAVYVPIAHDLPADRAAQLAARVEATILTGDAALAPAWAEAASLRFVPVVRTDSGQTCARPQVDADATAYILFTSGSTGEPKGVEVTHPAAMTTVNEMLARFAVDAGAVLYRQAALGFDLSVFDIFGAFSAGAAVVVPQREAKADAFAWVEDVREHQVTLWNSVPAALDMLLEAAGQEGLPSLTHILASGDWIPLNLPARARAASPQADFIALGGATEASIWSNFQRVEAVAPSWTSIPYGRPLGGQSMFVADAWGWPLPAGVSGEICIGGGALATGYWRDAQLTASKFPVHPVSGERIYRTGDLGRHFADGSIEFLGRMDKQVKLRGTRVDLREVEAALSAHPGVRHALVAALAAPDGLGVEAIGAYVVAEEGQELDLEGLRRHAERQLPPATWPSAYLQIPLLPLTGNGKVDRAALPDLRLGLARKERTTDALATPLEQRLAAIWHELLPGADCGRDDDFFALGGHSLLAVRLLARVRRDLQREVPLARWLERPTIAHLALLLGDGAGPAPAASARELADLLPHAQLAADLVFSPARTGKGAIVVTGATGLIGARVVTALLEDTDAEVICLVRDPQRPALPRSHARLQFMQGDLAQPRFGLAEAAFADLARRTACVFHVGAQVNLMAPYEALAPANVQGSHEAIRLAALAGGVLCHVSSIGVLPYGAGSTVREDDPLPLQGRLFTGYCESKWVAEQMVRAAMQRGLRAVVFRPGLTVGDGVLPAERDLLAAVLALSRHAGCLPASDLPVDLVDAGYAAAALARIGGDPRAIGKTFHLTHPRPVRLRQLIATTGAKLPLLPFAEWQARVAAQSGVLEDGRLAALAALVAQHKEADLTPALVDCSNTEAFLRGSAVRSRAIAELLGRVLVEAA